MTVDASPQYSTRAAAPERSLSGSSWYRPYKVALVAVDLAAVILGTGVAWAAGLTVAVAGGAIPRLMSVRWAIMVGAPAWLAMLAISGAYHHRWLGAGSDEYRRVLDAAIRLVVAVATTAFLFNVRIARGFLVIALATTVLVSLGLRFILRKGLHFGRFRGRFSKRVIVVGSANAAADVLEQLTALPQAGLHPVAACVPGGIKELDTGKGRVSVVALPNRALQAALIERADAIVIADATTLSSGELRQLAWQLEGTGIDLMVVPVVTDVAGPRIAVRPVSDLPLVHVEAPELSGARHAAKVLFDRTVALAGLVVLAPLLALIALSIRLTTRGPVLFRQIRVGLGGRHFVVWKFRTMTHDAESRLSEIRHLNEHDGLLFKMKDDPRVTKVGRFLRRWSLDELPQLWNVLRGDMSIVGPRPPIPSEVDRYDDQVRRRLLVQPGITGLWQVSGRAGLRWDEAVRLDLFYVENWSLSLDTMILLRTLVAVVRKRGAY